MLRCGAVAVSLLLTALPAVARADFAAAVAAYDRGDYETAFNEWLPLARDDDPAAQRNLAHLYRQGLGVAQDFGEAARWYRRAAYLGLAGAQANLGAMYLRGQGVAEDPEEAAYWFERAAVAGHVLAQYNLGLMYSRGLGVRQSKPRALAWLYLAAKGGHEQALVALSQMVQQEADTYGPPPPPPRFVEADEPPARAAAASAEDPDGAETPVETAPVDDDTSVLAWFGGLFSDAEASDGDGDGEPATDGGQAAAAATSPATEPVAEPPADATGLAPPRQPVFAYVLDPPPGSPSATTDEAATDRAAGRDPAAPGPAGPAPAGEPAPSADRSARATGDDTAASPRRRESAQQEAPQESLAVEPPAPADDDGNGGGNGGGGADRVMASGLIAYYSGNLQVAYQHWLPIADAGHREAQYQLGLLFDRPDFPGRDRSHSFKWLKLAADQGHVQAVDQLRRIEDDLTPLERLDGQRMAQDWRDRRSP